jgi:DNA-binding NarL/FixJ family response regulator
MARVLICDDHGLMREALTLTVQRCLPETEIVTCADFPASWAAAETEADLCICDLVMPGASPTEGLAKLIAIQPNLPIIVISGSASHTKMREILTLGVQGLIPKVTDGAIVEAAIRLVVSGGRYVPPELLDIAEKIQVEGISSNFHCPLTKVQTEVMRHLCDGKSNKEIAKTMQIAPSTVNTHVDKILEKMGAKNRTEASIKFSRLR